jgi:hypothetical protein
MRRGWAGSYKLSLALEAELASLDEGGNLLDHSVRQNGRRQHLLGNRGLFSSSRSRPTNKTLIALPLLPGAEPFPFPFPFQLACQFTDQHEHVPVSYPT